MKRSQIILPMPILAVFLVTSSTMLFAQATHQNRETPKQVQISVDYIDVTPELYNKASRQIPPGTNHDALLLSALIKSGAKDTQAPSVQTTDNVSANIDMRTKVPTTVAGKASSLTLHNSIDAKPHFNVDGTITLTLKMERDVLTPDANPPSATSTDFSTTRTFRDGETVVLGGLVSKTTPIAHLAFAKVMSISAR